MSRSDRFPKPTSDVKTEPFENAEEAWFWFIAAQSARNDGARVTAGVGLIARPCTPDDIFSVLNRLHRSRRLLMEHMLVLRHYGRRQLPPDPRRVKEARAFHLWKHAMERMEPLLVRKGIVKPRLTILSVPHKFWSHGATIHNGQGALPL